MKIVIIIYLLLGIFLSFFGSLAKSTNSEIQLTQFDASKYNRHLRFSDDLMRKQKGERVCFEFYDRLKDKDVSESKVIRWLEPTEIQTITSSNQIK